MRPAQGALTSIPRYCTTFARKPKYSLRRALCGRSAGYGAGHPSGAAVSAGLTFDADALKARVVSAIESLAPKQ